MVEQEDGKKSLRQYDIDRFNEVWGDRDIDAILGAMQIMRKGFESNLPIKEVAGKLGESFLIVPGNNEIGNNQLITLLGSYTADREGWDTLLDGLEQN